MSSTARSTSAEQPDSDAPHNDPLEAVRAVLNDIGIGAVRARRVLAMLAAGGRTRAELVRECAVPRRTVDELLNAAGGHIRTRRISSGTETLELAPDQQPRYRHQFELDELHPADAPSTDQPDADDTLHRVRRFVTSGPAPNQDLDHVTATAETVVARARWLRNTYDLAGARVLCLGDHDLTSLAVGLVQPDADIVVTDVDERILRHIDALADEHGLPVRTAYADLRGGLPPLLRQWADLVFTDPPYTPEGCGVFAARAIEAMADANSRLCLAYGFSARTPALGHKVQQELLRLGLVFTAILPSFNRYHGAEAVGSASDLYICQATTRARKNAPHPASTIYTHGAQAVEHERDADVARLHVAIAQRCDTATTQACAVDWTQPIRPADRSALPVFDLRADPGSWLLRVLLACDAPRMALLVRNNHPDITSQRAQHELAELIGPKYTLRQHRSFPDRTTAVVFAERATGPSAARDILHKAHGKLGNIAREALITYSAEQLTKRVARQRVRALTEQPTDLDLRLVDLPRHRIVHLLGQLRTATQH